MKNLIDVRNANDFVIGETYIENNYYIYTCVSKDEIFTADYNTTYQNIDFSVRTKTGRPLGTETYKYPVTADNMSSSQLLKEVQTLQAKFNSGVVSINEAISRLSALATESGRLFSDLYNAFDSDQPELIINMV